MLPAVFMHTYKHHNHQKAALPKPHGYCAPSWKEPGWGFWTGTKNHTLTLQEYQQNTHQASHKQCGAQPLPAGLSQTLSVLTKAGSFSILFSRAGKEKHK